MFRKAQEKVQFKLCRNKKAGKFRAAHPAPSTEYRVTYVFNLLCRKNMVSLHFRNDTVVANSHNCQQHWTEPTWASEKCPHEYRHIHKDTCSLHVQLFLIIHRIYICESTYLLNFICHPQIHTQGTSAVIQGRQRAVKNSSHLICTFFPAEAEQDDRLAPCFSSYR